MSKQLVRFINFGLAPAAPEKPDHGRRLYLLPSGDFATIDDAGVVTPLATDWDSISGKPAEFPPAPHTADKITDFASAVVAVSPPSVVEYPTRSSFPSIGKADRLYMALDEGMPWRWSPTANAYTLMIPIIDAGSF